MPQFKEGDVVRHRKGGLYVILAPPMSDIRLEYCNEPFYSYRDMKHNIWIRRQSEMEDGRFEKVK